MRVAIVGADAEHMSEREERETYKLCGMILNDHIKKDDMVEFRSGQSPKRGVDEISEQVARGLLPDNQIKIYPADKAHEHWDEKTCKSNICPGYKRRNLLIADDCDVLYCITWSRENEYCYHCDTKGHLRSGGCWTMKMAKKLGKETVLYVV